MSKTPRQPSSKSAIIDVTVLDAKCRKALMKQEREDLASDARVSYKTIQRAAAGFPISYAYIKRIAAALGIPPYELIKPDSVPLAPTATASAMKRVSFAGELDLPAEMYEAFQHERTAFKFYAALYLSDLLKDGAANIRLSTGSVLAVAELTPDDIRRIIEAFLAGTIEPLRVIAIRLGVLSSPPAWPERPEKKRIGQKMFSIDRDLVKAKPALLPGAILKLAKQGMSGQDIAAHLDVPIIVVRNTLQRQRSQREQFPKPLDDG